MSTPGCLELHLLAPASLVQEGHATSNHGRIGGASTRTYGVRVPLIR
jgi:hypothetical protein